MNAWYDSIIHSFFCYVDSLDTSSISEKVELAVVEKSGKYGLIHVNHLQGEPVEDGFYFEEMVIPCVFENLYYPDFAGNCCLFMIQDGKHGVLSLKAARLSEGVELFIEEMIPCRYDQINYTYDCPAAFVMRRSGKEYYYDLICNKISEPYDQIQCLCPNILGCWKWNKQIIVNLNDEAEFYQPEDGWQYHYVCEYNEGSVFRITQEEYTLEYLPVRLGFYSREKQSFYCTEIFDQVKIVAVDSYKGMFFLEKIDVFINNRWKELVMK